MAFTYDQVSAITSKYFMPTLAENTFDSNPLLKRAKQKFYKKIDGGERIIMPLGYATTTASGWYDGSDVLSTTDNQQITGAELTWKQLYANVTISRREELQNSGKSQIISLVKSKMQMAEKTMADTMGTALFNTGATADALIGLRAWVSATGTFVGGISQVTNSWWQAQIDSTTTTLSMAALQSLYNSASIDNDAPTVAMTTRTILNLYYALLQPQQRFVDTETAKGGFSSLMFNGIPVIADSHAPTSHLFMLNEKYLHLFAHKDEDMRFAKFESPVNQNIRVGKIYWAGAFGSNNNRLHGALTAITA